MTGPVHIALRAAEVEAMAAVLEEDHATVDDAAKAALKCAYRLFQRRDWWVAGARGARPVLDKETGERAPAPAPILFGPYATDGAALKALANSDLGLAGTIGIFRVGAVAKQQQRVADTESETARSADCARCGHNKASHAWPRRGPGCVGRGCGCPRYAAP